MKSARISIAVAMLFAGHVASQTPAVCVWAVSDGVRVNPVTGQVFEQRSDIHKDYPAGDFHDPFAAPIPQTAACLALRLRSEGLRLSTVDLSDSRCWRSCRSQSMIFC
jgi:hypothetical protein